MVIGCRWPHFWGRRCMAVSLAGCPSYRAGPDQIEEGGVMDLIARVAEAILASASDAVVATDRDGIVQVWNPGAERIFGYSADEALGRSLDLIIPERLRPRHWEGFRKVMETGAEPLWGGRTSVRGQHPQERAPDLGGVYDCTPQVWRGADGGLCCRHERCHEAF